MMSTYFYPGSSGGAKHPKVDEIGTFKQDAKPIQLSLLDWMLQRTEGEPLIKDQRD